MAKISEWARCEALRKLIARAIEDAWNDEDDNPEEYLIAISPELDEVHVLLDAETEDEWKFLHELEHEGWHIESATDYESAVDKADLYFDLR